MIKEYNRLLSSTMYKDKDYYQISRWLDKDNFIKTSINSTWCGFTEDKPPREIRKGRKLRTQEDLKSVEYLGQSVLVINSIEDMKYFYIFNGIAHIINEVAILFFRDLIEPREVVYIEGHGYNFVKDVDNYLLNRAPTRRLRMEVLKRDNFKCRICGRNPRDYVDVELNVHHIKPFSEGGLTEKNNLITLCKTCHDGLYPHFDYSLYSLIDIEKDPYAYYGFEGIAELRRISLEEIVKYK